MGMKRNDFFMQNDFFIFLCNAIFLSNEEKRLMSNHGNEEKRFFYAIFLSNEEKRKKSKSWE
jgi:hypothetical protein